jgi:hypothetical protein
MSDRASKALAEASLPGEPQTYKNDVRQKRSGVPMLPHSEARDSRIYNAYSIPLAATEG